MDGGVGYADVMRCAKADYAGHAARFELFFPVVRCDTFGYFFLIVAVGVSQAERAGVWSDDQIFAGNPDYQLDKTVAAYIMTSECTFLPKNRSMRFWWISGMIC